MVFEFASFFSGLRRKVFAGYEQYWSVLKAIKSKLASLQRPKQCKRTFLRFSDVFLGGSSHVSDSKQLLCNLDYQFVALTQCRPDLCIIGLVSYWTKHSRYRLFSQFHGALM